MTPAAAGGALLHTSNSVCLAMVNNEAQTSPGVLFYSVSSQLQARCDWEQTRQNLTFSHSRHTHPHLPSGKRNCLPSAIREPAEQYWRQEAAAHGAEEKTAQINCLFFVCLLCQLCLRRHSPGTQQVPRTSSRNFEQSGREWKIKSEYEIVLPELETV